MGRGRTGYFIPYKTPLGAAELVLHYVWWDLFSSGSSVPLSVSLKLCLGPRSGRVAPRVCQESLRTTLLQGAQIRGAGSNAFFPKSILLKDGMPSHPLTFRKLLSCAAAIQRPLGKNSFFIYWLAKHSIYQPIPGSSKDKMEVKPKRKIKALMLSCRLLLHFIVNWVR